MENAHQDDIEQLNSFLRGELSAVETYRQAIEKLDDEPAIRTALQENQRSHATRVGALEAEIRRLGGEPSADSGAWGSFVKLLEGGAKLFGDDAALSVLEEGEEHGLNDYQRDLDELTPGVRQFVETRLLPEQRRTRGRLEVIEETV